MTEVQDANLRDAIEMADVDPFQAMRFAIETVTGTEADILESGAAVLSIPAPLVLEVLGRLDALSSSLVLPAEKVATFQQNIGL